MKTRRRIRLFTPQYIARPWRAISIFLLFSLIIFLVLISSAYFIFGQNLISDKIITLVIISPLLVLGLFFDTKVFLRFPYFIQRHLIHPHLKMDLKNVALRSSDGKILNFRTQKSAFWRPAQTQLLIQCHDHAEPMWFDIDLAHVFSTQYFRQIEVEANPKLIGQQVHFYYLAASKCIIQMYSQSPNDDFSILKRYLEQPYAHQVIIEQIPTRLIQDLPNMIQIEAVRDHQKSFDLKLRTSYGHIYQVQSTAKAFDQLELALSSLLDFVCYRRFKQNLDIKHSIVSKPHTYRYRNLMIYSLLLILPILIVVTGNWLFVILAIGIYWFYIKTSIQQQVPPFISEEHY